MTTRSTFTTLQAHSRSTQHFIELLMSLNTREFKDVTFSLETGGKEDLIALHLASFTRTSLAWLEWERNCRNRPWRRECRETVEAIEQTGLGVATYYNTTLKTLVVKACTDLAPDWLVPYWVKWFAHHNGLKELFEIHKLDTREQLNRLVDYPIYTYMLHGIGKALIEEFEQQGGTSSATAMYIYWDIIEPLYEVVVVGLEPLPSSISEELRRVSYKAYNATRRAINSKGRLGLLPLTLHTSRSLREKLARYLVFLRTKHELGSVEAKA